MQHPVHRAVFQALCVPKCFFLTMHCISVLLNANKVLLISIKIEKIDKKEKKKTPHVNMTEVNL